MATQSTTLHRNPLRTLYVASFLFAGHLALTAYINSSFLGTHVDKNVVGILYTIGSILVILGLLQMPTILNRFGGRKTLSFFILLSMASLLGLFILKSPNLIVPIFIIYLASNSLIFFGLDIFVENYSEDTTTGKTRAFFLTAMNIAWVLSPFLAGLIVNKAGFTGIYGISLLVMIPVFLILFIKFKQFKDPNYIKVPLREILPKFVRNKNIFKVFRASFLLQFFYAWMVIYTPIYLNQYIGFSWDKIGIIFTIMLLPFILLEIPMGRLADRKFGEKEIMTIGFCIMALATISIIFISKANIITWALVLFSTRIGASMVEIMTESYFFKQIDVEDTDIISFYRNASPLAYIIAPLVATGFLLLFPFKFLFLALGIIMLSGLFYSLTIVDTK